MKNGMDGWAFPAGADGDFVSLLRAAVSADE